jgi:voltage-dependent potassium channel beta subunit
VEYRQLGRSGLRVSELGLGSWMTFERQLAVDQAVETMGAAYEAGVNLFDTAESYADGAAESILGEALQRLGWDRRTFVVSTKFYWGTRDGVNSRRTLSRKYLLEAIGPSLDRLRLDYVDLVLCHRPDPNTPIEETVQAMHAIIERGQALYWGTSEWAAADIRAAWDTADRHGWHRPVMEQVQYNLFVRERMEGEYERLFADLGLGAVTWSPLKSGVLSGKYLDGVPEGSRATREDLHSWVRETLIDSAANARVRELVAVAKEFGCRASQLAIAWCLTHPHVSAVLTGASSPQQLHENLGALEIAAELTPQVRDRIAAVFD